VLRRLPVVVVDEAAEDPLPDHLALRTTLDWTLRRMEPQRPMRPAGIVVVDELVERPSQMVLVQDDDVIQALLCGSVE